MVSWYYVQGTERVGPVGVETLKELFLKEEINLESYVWRKGFQNWERLKDVSELNFEKSEEVPKPKIERRVDNKIAQKEKEITEELSGESSVETSLSFNWESISDEDELFFLKIGHDRKAHLDTELFGPYSLKELHDAIEEKRINNRTLIFAAGMPGWVEIGDTPLNPKNLKLNTSNILDEAPLLIAVENDPLPLFALVQNAGVTKCILLGSGPFQEGKVVMASLYSGSALKARNVKLSIEEYRPREQKIFCSVVELSETAKKVMQNYAE